MKKLTFSKTRRKFESFFFNIKSWLCGVVNHATLAHPDENQDEMVVISITLLKN